MTRLWSFLFIWFWSLLFIIIPIYGLHVSVNVLETATGTILNLKNKLQHNNILCSDVSTNPHDAILVSVSSCDLIIARGRHLDFESESEINLTIIATYFKANGQSFLDEEVTVNVKVVDVNDEAPIFTPVWPAYPTAPASAVLVEGSRTRPGTRVFQAHATDADASANLQYTWTPGRRIDTEDRFYLSPFTGVITTVGAAPFPVEHAYRLSIRVTDLNSVDPAKGFTDMQLTVFTSPQPAHFPLPVFSVEFPENLPVGTQIGYIPALPINNAYDKIKFTFLRRPEVSMEPVDMPDGANGMLRTRRVYDFEKTVEHSWPYLVEATENSMHTATALMIVTLIDVDDNPPYFQLAAYESDFVLETVPNNTVVLEVMPDDRDVALENRQYVYTISGNEASSFFVTKGITGAAQIHTMRPLRFDNLPIGRPFYEMSLRAASPSGAATAVVRILIQNANRNAPVMADIPHLQVFRDQSPVHAFFQLTAYDADGSPVFFYFVDNTTDLPVTMLEAFEITPVEGNVFLKSKPELKTYYLKVHTADDGTCPGCPEFGTPLVSETTMMVVTIVDRNQYLPVFTKCPSTMSIVELAAAGTVIGDVAATDKDDVTLAKTLIEYELFGNTVFARPEIYLAVDSKTGQITNQRPLERTLDMFGGVLPDQLYFTIRAIDWGVPRFWTLCNFQLIVVDVNNNPPIFDPQTYSVVLQRDRYLARRASEAVVQVVAVDLDEPDTENSVIDYSFKTTQSHFSIDSKTGIIRASGILTEPSYDLVVMATNPTPLRSHKRNWQEAMVTVKTTTDVNLLPPHLRISRIKPTFLENQSHIEVALVSATPYTGADYAVFLEQVPGAFEQTGWLNSPPPFTSEMTIPTSLKLFSGSHFLYQRLHWYTVRVRGCRQPTDPILGEICSHVVMNFQVVDVNNRIPQFIDTSILAEVSIPENAIKGTEMLKLFAIDTDTVPAFRKVTYSLVTTTDSPNFIMLNNVLVTNVEPMDFERKKNYVVKVKAQDGAPSSLAQNVGEPNSAELTLTVLLLDVNDNAPIFTATSYQFTVSETAPIGHVVGTVLATDGDEKPNFVYLMQTTVLDFAVNSITGQIIVARRLSLATIYVYNFKMTVSDGKHTATVDVMVTVLRSNERLPIFGAKSYTYTVREQAVVALLPAPVATDPNEQSTITYSLGGEFRRYFSIDATTGALQIVTGFDRDKPDGLPVYRISVIALNAIGPSYAEVRIVLIDINNEFPRWMYPNQTVFMPENSPVSIPFAEASAPDADEGVNAKSTYVVSPADPNFQISRDGRITSLKTYDYERFPDLQFYLPITATNIQPPSTGGKFFSTTGTLTISLVDTNDIAPTILEGSSFDVPILETVPIGVDFYTFLIDDSDAVDRRQFTCELITPNDYFTVAYLPDIDACGIRPTVKLNVDVSPSIPPGPQTLGINVLDGGRLHAISVSVKVTVLEANNNRPLIVIQPSSGPGQVLDGTIGPLSLSVVRVTVQDAVENTFTFTLDSKSAADGTFGFTSVEPMSARLTLISRLNRDTLKDLLTGPNSPTGTPVDPPVGDGRVHWPLIVRVSDQRYPAQTSTSTLTLTVVTRGPTLPKDRLEGYTIPDGSEPNTLVQPTGIGAIDVDNPDQTSSITYSIASTAELALKLFSLSSTQPGTFQLVARTKIHRETEGTSTIPVAVVAVLGSQTRTATSTLTVTITSNNPPVPTDGYAVTEAYVPIVWGWPYLNAVQDIPVAYMPIGEKYPTDRATRLFQLVTHDEDNLVFSIKKDGLLVLKTASPACSRLVTANVTSPSGGTWQAVSWLNLTVNWLSSSGLINGLIVRINQASPGWFLTSLNLENPPTPSPRDRFVMAIASELEIPAKSITMFPLNQVGDSLNVFIGLHQSPYQVPGRLVDSLTKNASIYNTALNGGNANIPVKLATEVSNNPGPLVFHCSSEAAAMSACNQRGCRSVLTSRHTPPPQTSPAIGMSSLSPVLPSGTAVGPILETTIDCWCNGADPRPPALQPMKCDQASACLNGGTCRHQPGTDTLICICPPGYDGRRCEQTAVYFIARGYAWSPGIGSCSQLHIRLALYTLITSQSGLLFYAGPINEQAVEQTRPRSDFIGLQMEGASGQRLKLVYNLGSGPVTGVADLPTESRLNDGRWHTIDVIIAQEITTAVVTLIVDDCRFGKHLDQVNGLATPPDLSDCLFRFPNKDGFHRALNVGQWPLQVGGLWGSGLTAPPELPTGAFLGGIRDFVVNGEMWNLAQHSTGLNALTRHPKCSKEDGTLDVCSPNGVCQGKGDLTSPTISCKCHPGYRLETAAAMTNPLRKCVPSLESVELGPSPSYLQLTAKTALSSATNDIQTEVSFAFRTRSPNGVLIYLSGPKPDFYRNSSLEIRLRATRIEVEVNLGNFNPLTVSPARRALNDGAWHSVALLRSLSSLRVSVDGAAGSGLSALLSIDPSSTYLRLSLGTQILLGGRRDELPGDPPLAPNMVKPAGSSIGNTCFRDLRINSAWYPLTKAEIVEAGSEGEVSSIQGSDNVFSRCSDLTACPSKSSMTCPGSLVCVPTWKPVNGKYTCTCPEQEKQIGDVCYPLAPCSLFPCQNGGVCRPSTIDPRGFLCLCPPTFSGQICEFPVMQAGLGIGAIVGIVISILIIIGFIIGIVIWRVQRQRRLKVLSPDQELRENVMPYFEGAGEVDTHNFDLKKIESIYIDAPRNPQQQLPSYVGTVQSTTYHNPGDSTSFGQMLVNRLADDSEMIEPPPDYTLDYGYEGGASEGEDDEEKEEEKAKEDEDSEIIESMSSQQTQPSIRNPPTFGDAFEELERLPDENDGEEDDDDDKDMYLH